MISVILYGRNDEHGYNLHKRAALSINSLAENLVAPEDEIVFVDWNTNPSRPPFLVAIRDVLSDKARGLTKIVVVPPEVHRAATKGQSKLPVVEPIARNVGVRFAAPKNQWLLSTNTDVLIGGQGPRLSSIVADLAPGFYTAPRYELPEWMWESLSRVHEKQTQHQIDQLVSRRLPLVMVRSYEGFTFDGGGDFQLFSRAAFDAIGGFDETMHKGWHVDANFAKRMSQHCGQVGELVGDLRILHTNHNRTHTQYTEARSESNDLEKYFFGSVPTASRAGRTGWGLPDVPLPSISLDEYATRTDRLAQYVLSGDGNPEYSSASDPAERLRGVDFKVTLPFLLDAVMCGFGVAKVDYIGTRAEFGEAIKAAVGAIQQGAKGGSNATAWRSLVVVDCTPVTSLANSRQLSDLSRADRRAIYDALLATRELVLLARRGMLKDPIFAFVNFEGNELTPIARSVVGDASAQYYARLRFGTLCPAPGWFSRLQGKGARFILRLAWISGVHFLLRASAKLNSEPGSITNNDSARVRSGADSLSSERPRAGDPLVALMWRSRELLVALSGLMLTCLKGMMMRLGTVARRIAFSKFRSQLVAAASLESGFTIPKGLRASCEDGTDPK